MKPKFTFQSRRPRPIKDLLARKLRWLLLFTCLGVGFSSSLRASEATPLQLTAAAQVCGDGVFLPQLFQATQPLPAIRLCDAPAFGKNLVLTRAQIADLLAANAPDCGTNFSGADSVRISRRMRTLGESDMLGLLTAGLQHDYIKDKGQLELHLAQPWSPLLLPDEPLTLDVLEMPAVGVTPSFIVRFTLRTAHETLGTWSANLQAHVWREVLVASSQLQRGEAVSLDQFARERRDLLLIREPIAELEANEAGYELAEPVPTGAPLLTRMLKTRAVIHRGQRADALVQDGPLSVSTKVEVLEDGAPGQTIRARNSLTHRDLTGKVLDEKTILISL
jgi:flagella basal body P-ring formation protein FlgA